MLLDDQNQSEVLLEDCLSALSGPIHNLTRAIKNEQEVIKQTLEISASKQMQVIEQQTDRQGDEQHSNYKLKEYKRRFNVFVRNIIDAKKSIEEITNIYKIELRGLAEQIFKANDKIKRIQQEKQDVKVSKRKKSQASKSPAPEKRQEDQQIKARPAPSPFQEQPCPNCSILNQRVQILEKQSKNWKMLSAKIDDCKKKIAAYEGQIKAKDIEMELLKAKENDNQAKTKSQRDEEDKKRLKKDNTTLRGQKVLMGNQLAALRRQLAEKTSVSEALEAEVTRLRLQVDNLNSSLNWHSTNLSELRVGVQKSRNQEWRELGGKIQYLTKMNKKLNQALENQQQILNQMNEKSKKVEDALSKQSQKRQRKINELETILEDKNQTIIRLKTGMTKVQKNDKGGYHADMVKVLNKRLAEREERVRVLEDALGRVSQLQ